MGTVALYMRLSSEDADAGESASIGNQRDLLYDYIRDRREFDSCHVMEFCDDGYSGTNFDRPGVQKMLSLAGNTVKCIIVKDFSRFGRNLIEVGDYLDQIFPFLGVRFIAVNEGYDSKQSLGSSVSLDVSLKAMIYEMYSRDISEKIRCVQQAKMRRGEYLSGAAFYGYRLSQTEKKKLVVDEPAAEVVRRIFYLAAEGIPTTKIAAALNRDGVPSPLMYRRENHTDGIHGWKVASDTAYWTCANVRRTITDERYTGCMVSHKRTKADVSTKRTEAVPREDWIVVEGTHEAIVPKDIFDRAQSALRNYSRARPTGKPSCLFRGLVKCAHCGKALAVSSRKRPYFYCTTRRVMPDLPCKEVHLEEKDLEKTLFHAIRTQVQLIEQPAYAGQDNRTMDSLKEALRECQEMSGRYKAMQTSVFEDYAEGRIGKQEYLSHKKDVVRKQEETARRYAELSEQVAVGSDAAHLTGDLESYAFAKELTREMLEELIKTVRVSGKDTIEIVWNFKEWKADEGQR